MYRRDPVPADLLTVKEVAPPADLLTVKEVARWLRLTERTIYRMIDDGRLSSSRMGREYRIHRESVEALLKPVNTKETQP